MGKIFDAIIGPPAILFLAIDHFITGKPFYLDYIADKIEGALSTRVREIDIGNGIDKEDKNIYFHTQLKRNPATIDISRIGNTLQLSRNEIRITQGRYTSLMVIFPDKTINKIRSRINKFPNLWQKIMNKIYQ